jgi:hypothetical protein
MCHNEPMDYESARTEAKKYYRTIGTIFSPALGELVHFSREGFGHIIWKSKGDKRKIHSQMERFASLVLAAELVGLATTYQEFEELIRIGTVKKAHYWGVIAILHERKIKVVIRRIGENGVAHFWSVIPNCITSPRRDKKFFER